MNLLPQHDLYVTVPLPPSRLCRGKREDFIVEARQQVGILRHPTRLGIPDLDGVLGDRAVARETCPTRRY
jgi:hypothetical protein